MTIPDGAAPVLHPALSTEDTQHARNAFFPYDPSPDLLVPAQPVLLADATEEAWLAARRKGIGASQMAAVLGVSPFASPFALWWQKREGWDIEQTTAMRIGTLMEDVIAGMMRHERPDMFIVRPAARLYSHWYLTEQLATPDFLALVPRYDGSTVVGVDVCPVECKSDEGGPGWGPSGEPEVPEHHKVQALCQANIFGSPRAYIARVAGKRFTWHPIDNGEQERSQWWTWAQKARAFLYSLDGDEPPPIDGHRSTEDALKRVLSNVDPDTDAWLDDGMADQYLQAVQAKRDADEHLAKMQNAVRWAMGNAGLAMASWGQVAQRQVYKRHGYTVPPTTVDRLVPRRKESHDG